MKTTCELFLRVSLLLLKFRSTLSKGSDRATSPSCCPESGCRDNYFRSCTSYSRSVPFLPRGAGARSHAMAAASTATVLSPLSHSKGGERATSSEWARAGSDTAREGRRGGQERELPLADHLRQGTDRVRRPSVPLMGPSLFSPSHPYLCESSSY